MKRALLVFLLILLSLEISASYSLSNQLGQKKGSADSPSSSEWVLEERGSTQILYHNGVEYSRKVTSSSGWTKTREGEEERVFLNSDGNIERKIITSGSSTAEYNYIYSGTLLTGYNYAVDGLIEYKVEYVTTKSGLLLYYREKDEGVFITDEWFVFENGERMEVGSFSSLSVISKETEDGGYEEVSASGTRRYDSSGRLVSEKTEEKEVSYTYSDDGSLSEKKEKSSDGICITSYTKEGKVLSRYSSDGVKISERREMDDTTIEERRFVDGKAKYVFIYDSDGKRIKEAYAL